MNWLRLVLILAGIHTMIGQTPPPTDPSKTAPPSKKKVKKPKNSKKTAAQPPKEIPVVQPQLPDFPPKSDPVNEVEQKLDGALLSLLRSLKAGGAIKALADASADKLPTPRNRIKVDITLIDPSTIKDIETKIRETGGEVITVLDNRVFAWLPLEAIEPLGASPNVWSLAAVRETVNQK